MAEARQELADLPLKGSSKFHMIAFAPDGSIIAKYNICSCTACLEGKLLKCVTQHGRLVQSSELVYCDDSSDENDSASESEEEA